MTRNDNKPDVLLVEDNPGDIRLIQVGIQQAGFGVRLHKTTDGVEAVDFLNNKGTPCPDLVLLDLNLPRKDGLDILEDIRSHSELSHLPVLILTSSTASEDIRACYEQQANAYLTKPDDPESLVELIQSVERFWFEKVQLPTCT
ncbi:response regulator [Natrarchaeobius chitinivorans]|uniref:Response regulator n=1 Tax=Natrarchaeobius chitinivorans TaxID=1679083 RepID=A0A3N6NCU7_NATCH|nr:response regulator [Natrarchaeobius chitinivorans]